jgi:tetratricopeptide (TPR) repeat protein
MGWGRRARRIWTSSLLLVPAAAVLVTVVPATPAWADDFDKALAEIDKALETNPYSVSEDSLKSCEAMRNTAVLLRKMGQIDRAVRRLKSCRKLLGLEAYSSQIPSIPGDPWFA